MISPIARDVLCRGEKGGGVHSLSRSRVITIVSFVAFIREREHKIQSVATRRLVELVICAEMLQLDPASRKPPSKGISQSRFLYKQAEITQSMCSSYRLTSWPHRTPWLIHMPTLPMFGLWSCICGQSAALISKDVEPREWRAKRSQDAKFQYNTRTS